MKKILALMFCLIAFGFNNVSIAADVDEMIGQMIILGFKGNSVKSKGFKTVLNQVEKGEIGGVIFFEDNIKNKE